MAIYSHGGPAIITWSRTASRAHADHVGRRHSEGNHDMRDSAARAHWVTVVAGEQLRLGSGYGATYALSNSDVIRSLPSPNWNGSGTNRGGESPTVRFFFGAGGLIHFGTLYHGTLLQFIWQSIFRATFLQILHENFINPLYQSYSPMFQLQFCYGNHDQTCTGSRLNLGSKIYPPHCQTKFQSWVSLTALLQVGLSPNSS
jgi:hypothetical protein